MAVMILNFSCPAQHLPPSHSNIAQARDSGWTTAARLPGCQQNWRNCRLQVASLPRPSELVLQSPSFSESRPTHELLNTRRATCCTQQRSKVNGLGLRQL